MDMATTRDQVPQIARHQPVARPHTGMQAFRAAGQGGAGITGKDILRMLRKRMWMIIITSVTVMSLVMAVTLVWYIYAPMYTASAFLLVSPPAEGTLGSSDRLYSKAIMQGLVMSHVQMVLSQPVLNSALATPEIRKTEWFKKTSEASAVQKLAKAMSVSPIINTNFIRLSMTATAPTAPERMQLAEIVNAVAQEFVKNSRENINRERQIEMESLNNEREALEDNRQRVNIYILDARKGTGVSDLSQRRGTLQIQLELLTDQLMRYQLYYTQADTAYQAFIRQEESGTLGSAPEVVQALEMDQALRALRGSETNLMVRLESLRTKFGSNHREIRTIENNLKSMKTEIAAREKVITERSIGYLRAKREAERMTQGSQLNEIQMKFDAANTRVQELQSTTAKIEQLGAERVDLSLRIKRISDTLLVMRVRVSKDQQVTLRSRATIPRIISKPRLGMMIPLAIVLGLACGLGLAFLIEAVDTSIKNPSDLSRRMDLPMLGMIPHEDDLEEEIDDLRLAFLSNPGSLMGEAFRQVRTCLLFSGPESQRRSVLVTSPLPEDGRTTVTMNLAGAISSGGRRVLVVDTNFRQPGISSLFPDCPPGGLSSALVGQAQWRDLVYEVNPNLHVLAAGILPPNPAELLGSQEMRVHLDEMVQQYDQVLLDGAPCLVVTDSAVLSTLVDGVILTVRAGVNTHGIVQRTRDILMRVGGHIIGSVLNGVRVTAGGYLRKSYETFYEYREQAQLPGQK